MPNTTKSPSNPSAHNTFPSASLSKYCSSSTFPYARCVQFQDDGTITLKCLLKGVSNPDVNAAVMTLRSRNFPRASSISLVSTLLLSGNRIRDLSPLVQSRDVLQSLHSLSLADNLIVDICQVTSLASLPTLRQLIVTGNPCMVNDESRPKRSIIVAAFRGTLKSLDSQDCDSLASIDHAVKTSKFGSSEGR